MWYMYYQNNPGGRFHEDDYVGHVVMIEAGSYRSADDIAEQIGIYFDGVNDGRDCSCCGDRWGRAECEGIRLNPRS